MNKKLLELKTPQWYRCEADAEAKTATITIDGVIGGDWMDEGVTAKEFCEMYRSLDADEVTLHVNSLGGSVWDGIAIYNCILGEAKKRCTVIVDSIAASIASVIALAGEKLIMPETSYLMIHNPWTFAAGNAKDFRNAADQLDKLAETIAGVYARKTGKELSEIQALMDGADGADGTWINAEEAKTLGFADEVSTSLKAAACIGADLCDNLPENLKRINDAAEKRKLEKLLAARGYSQKEAKAIASGTAFDRDGQDENGDPPHDWSAILSGLKK